MECPLCNSDMYFDYGYNVYICPRCDEEEEEKSWKEANENQHIGVDEISGNRK